MPSPPVEEGFATSQSTQESTKASQNPSRSILSFWSSGAGPSQPPQQPPVTKRKRKKADEGPAQGRISLGNGDGATWGIKKVEEKSVAVAAKGKTRAKPGGEQDELKEMSKKVKQAVSAADYDQIHPGKRKSFQPDNGPKPTTSNGGELLFTFAHRSKARTLMSRQQFHW